MVYKQSRRLASGMRIIIAMIAVSVVSRSMTAAEPKLKVEQAADRLVITADGKPLATYVFADKEVLRPYFANVHAPGGGQVTRNHPPREGVDATDHPTMHPGIWLAFGDLGGADFWRNKGRVEHVRFIEKPAAEKDTVRFAAEHRYLDGDRTVCSETTRYTLTLREQAYLLTFDSEFSGDKPFVFGDQEEMGLGIRMATPLTVKSGTGRITNSEGLSNESEVWGRRADWCAYAGTLPDAPARRAGILVVPHRENFRPSWCHARDYGVLVANPFGQNAFTKGDKSRVEIKPGQKLRLRFGLWILATNVGQPANFAALADEYVRLANGH